MPQAKPAFPPQAPIDLSDEESAKIRAAAIEIFGPDVVVRNYGTDPNRLSLYIEAPDVNERRISEFLGLLYTWTEREGIGAGYTRRGTRVSGQAKIALRQGVIL